MKEFFKNILSSKSNVSSKRFSGMVSILFVLIITTIIILLDLVFDLKINNTDLVSGILNTIFVGGTVLLGVAKLSENIKINK